MGHSRNEIKEWFEEMYNGGFNFMLVVTDTFDYTTYAVGVQVRKFWEKHDYYNNPDKMSRVMEVYNLDMDVEEQLDERRAFHYPEEK